MANFIVIADMGEAFDRKKEILENVTEQDAANLAWELANEIYQSYEGRGGIYSLEDFIEEYQGDKIAAEESYKESIDSWVTYYIVEITNNTPRCPSCGEPLSREETKGWCINCDEYCGDHSF